MMDTFCMQRFVTLFIFVTLAAMTSANALAAPIEIGTIEDLQKIGNDPAYPLDGQYALTQDIDASATATWGSGAGFTPIANAGLSFTGTLDGQGHVISQLTINRPDETAIALFAAMNSGGQIKNVGLEACAISGSGLNSVVAGLVGYHNQGMVTRCHATGTVSVAVRNSVVGGLVGNNSGGTLTQCYATVTVSVPGLLTSVGGLVGLNYLGTVTQCYATGTVTGTFGDAGGLVGHNDGTLIQCYATGMVSDGNGHVGGLAGLNLSHGIVTQCYATGTATITVAGLNNVVGGLVGDNSGEVTQCYATGAVSASDLSSVVGGLVGSNRAGYGTVDSSYWGTTTSGQASSAGGTGELTAAMMAQATYVNWDFQDVWGIVESDTYPFLRSLHAEGSPLPLATPRTLFISIAGIALASALILRRVKQGRPVNGGAQAGTVS